MLNYELQSRSIYIPVFKGWTPFMKPSFWVCKQRPWKEEFFFENKGWMKPITLFSPAITRKQNWKPTYAWLLHIITTIIKLPSSLVYNYKKHCCVYHIFHMRMYKHIYIYMQIINRYIDITCIYIIYIKIKIKMHIYIYTYRSPGEDRKVFPGSPILETGGPAKMKKTGEKWIFPSIIFHRT